MSTSPRATRKETVKSQRAAMIEALIVAGKGLLKLDHKLTAQQEKDAELLLTGHDGRKYIVTREDIAGGWKQYWSGLKELKTFGTGVTKARTAAKPDEFKGVFNRVYVGPALRNFIKAGDFGLDIDGRTPIKTAIPYAQAGYAIKQTLVLLLNIYMTVRGLRGIYDAEGEKEKGSGRIVTVDSVLAQSLNGNIPAVFRYVGDGGKRLKELEDGGANTFDVIKDNMSAPKPGENPYKGSYISPDNGTMSTVLVSSIVAVNYIGYNAIEQLLRQIPAESQNAVQIAGESVPLADVFAALDDAETKKQMVAEYKRLKALSDKYAADKKQAEKDSKNAAKAR